MLTILVNGMLSGLKVGGIPGILCRNLAVSSRPRRGTIGENSESYSQSMTRL